MSYSIPSMRSIKRTPKRATAISTFSGAGGGCLGLRWAGFDVLWASEFIDAAADVYAANFSTPVDRRDIREVGADEIRAVVGDVEIDLLEGSPPCAAFSTAGSRHKAWGEVRKYSDTEQRVDDLFFEYVRLLRALKPKTFVAENVPALAQGKAFGVYREIKTALIDSGYQVDAVVLDASWLGTPQARKRLFFVGVRDDLEKPPPQIAPFEKRISIREACPWIEGDEHGPGEVEAVERGTALTELRSAEWRKLRLGEKSKKYIQMRRSAPWLPAFTFTVGGYRGSDPFHPYQPRRFSIPELRRLSGFPDDFKLLGTYEQRYERLARAVCPPVMRAIGEALLKEVL